MADETTQDKVKAITGGLTDIIGAVGAVVSGGKAQVKQEILPSGQRVSKQDYTPYLIAGGAAIAAAGVLGYFLLRSRRVAMNPGKKRRGSKRRGSRRRGSKRRHLLSRLSKFRRMPRRRLRIAANRRHRRN